MWTQRNLSVVLTGALAYAAMGAAPLGSEFIYQGKLNLAGSPVNDTADFEFTLWDQDLAGTMIGSVVAVDNVLVVDGVFTAEIDFGADSFNGDQRWLDISVRSPAGAGEYSALTPRQPLTATPYALQTRGIFVSEDGHVGLGTTDPEVELHLKGQRPKIRLEAEPGQNPSINLHDDIDQRAVMGWAANDVVLKLKAEDNLTGSQGVNIAPGGNVGIGTTEPTSELEVAGAVTANALHVDDLTLNVDPVNGRVGIGTASPSAKLEVDGTVVASNPGGSPDGSSIELASPGGEVGVVMRLGDGAGAEIQRWDMKIEEDDSSFHIRNSTVGESPLTISSAGEVGIDGSLNMMGHTIGGVASPSSSDDVATKDYVDALVPNCSGPTLVKEYINSGTAEVSCPPGMVIISCGIGTRTGARGEALDAFMGTSAHSEGYICPWDCFGAPTCSESDNNGVAIIALCGCEE